MSCRYLVFADGSEAILCGVRAPRRCPCGDAEAFRCDWPVGTRRDCDASLCAGCRVAAVAPDGRAVDLCWRHHEEWDRGDPAAWPGPVAAPDPQLGLFTTPANATKGSP